MQLECIFDPRKITSFLATLAFIGPVLVGGTAWAHCPDDDEFTTDFRLGDCSFASTGANAYFSIEPGYQLILEGEEDGEIIRAESLVLNETKLVDGVETRVLEEREFVDDVLIEISRNFFVRCEQTNAMLYLGEESAACDPDETGGFDEVDEAMCADGEEPDSEGSWEAGKKNAKGGLIMPGTFLLGSKYFQEQARNAALDRGENVAMGLMAKTAAGNFKDCVAVLDTNPLDDPPVCTEEDGGDLKLYCPGIGLVADEELDLIEINGNFE